MRGKLGDEPWSRHATWRVPCYVAQGSGQQAHATPLFAVHTTVVQRTVSADVDQLDFGQLAVGQTRVLPLRLRNRGPTAIGPPTAEGLNGTGPFAVVNALRGLPPATGLHVALVRFAPMAQGVRSEPLVLHCAEVGKTVRVTLRGEGVSPTLEKEPRDGCLDLGHVVAGGGCSQVLVLRNTSVFPLAFSLAPVDDAHENFDHQSPFVCVPSEATIEPGAACRVKVRFEPDHERVAVHAAAAHRGPEPERGAHRRPPRPPRGPMFVDARSPTRGRTATRR